MKIIIAYDIIDNKIRNNIIEILLEMGLIRIQNPYFLEKSKRKK